MSDPFTTSRPAQAQRPPSRREVLWNELEALHAQLQLPPPPRPSPPYLPFFPLTPGVHWKRNIYPYSYNLPVSVHRSKLHLLWRR